MEEAEADPENSKEEEEPRRKKKKWLKPFLTRAKVSLNPGLPVYMYHVGFNMTTTYMYSLACQTPSGGGVSLVS